MMLEVCVDSAAGLRAAIEGGADRVELCSALAVGGLTPSLGQMRDAALEGIPSYVLIRPRAGDFIFSEAELDIMKEDIRTARDCGLAGVVLGAETESGVLDMKALEVLVTVANGLGTTLHRVFDGTPDKAQALEDAIALGFDRVLTSGGAAHVMDGVETLSGLVSLATGRISVMPGAGLTLQNAAHIALTTGASEFHASCSAPVRRRAGHLFASDAARETDAALVRALKAKLQHTLAALQDGSGR
jgi:copper homeostasis protein